MAGNESGRIDWLNRRESIGALRTLDEAELDRRHDALAGQLNKRSPRILAPIERQELLSRIDAYLRERERRELEEQGKRMETLTRSLNRLTWWIVALTVLIAIATIIGVGLTAVSLLLGG
jgi:hypothetical protein